MCVLTVACILILQVVKCLHMQILILKPFQNDMYFILFNVYLWLWMSVWLALLCSFVCVFVCVCTYIYVGLCFCINMLLSRRLYVCMYVQNQMLYWFQYRMIGLPHVVVFCVFSMSFIVPYRWMYWYAISIIHMCMCVWVYVYSVCVCIYMCTCVQACVSTL